MTSLIVALPMVRPAVGTEFAYVLSRDGVAVDSHGFAALALLPPADSVVLVVPARLLSWHELRLPPVASGRLRAALEGALEDRLLDEPGQLAFAVGPPRGPDGGLLVAVCDKAWLQDTLTFFEQAQRPAARVVPEFAPLQDGEGDQQRLIVTGSLQEPWLTAVDHRGAVSVPLSAAAAVVAADAFALAPLCAEPEVAALAEQQLARAVEVVPTPERLLDSAAAAWELAQFDLTISHRGRMARRWALAWQRFARAPGWRSARWGLAALVAANLVGLNASAWQQQNLLQSSREQVRALLSATFPRVRTIVDAPLQMARELALLRQSSGAADMRDLEVMLAAIGSSLPPGKVPAALTYAPGETSVRGLALDAAQAPQVLARLAGMGYVARLEGDVLQVRSGPPRP